MQTFTAATANEALDLLDAARKQVEARMLALAPGDATARFKAQATAPVALRISLDLTALEQLAAERQAFRDQITSERWPADPADLR